LRIYSIRSRLMFHFCTLLVISTIVNTLLSYYSTSRLLEEKSITYSKEVIDQTTKTIDAYFRIIDRLAMQISYDGVIQGLLQKDYETSINRDYYLGVDQMAAFPYLEGIRSTSSSFKGLFIYRNDGHAFYSYPSSLINYNFKQELSRINSYYGDSKDFRVIRGPYKDSYTSFPDGMTVLYISKIYDFRKLSQLMSLDKIGMLVMQIDLSNMVKELLADSGNRVSMLSNTYILNQENKIVYSSSNPSLINENFDNKILQMADQTGNNYFKAKYNGETSLITLSKSKNTNWRIINVTSQKELIKGIELIRNKSIIICLILVVCVLIISYMMARTIVNPIKKLKEMMLKVGSGKFGHSIPLTFNSELNLLAQGYNTMSSRLQELVDEIYIKEGQKRKAEVVALQSQINPHFIYNTLETIKQMAVIQKTSGVVEMTESLIKLLESSAKYNEGLITIEMELELLKSYIYIQETRYYGKFNVSFNYEESVLQYKTLNLILQPVVENAIFHGIVPKNGIGSIDITIREYGEEIAYIITDNGIGMPKERIKQIFNNSQEGHFNKLGLYNVNQRIKLYFGEKYGVQVQSEIDRGTEVIIAIPKVLG
jgi:two-component system sensor histidine kinase YesM